MDYDRFIVDAVRNHLFQRPGGPLTGLDLPAVNMQRGRWSFIFSKARVNFS